MQQHRPSRPRATRRGRSPWWRRLAGDPYLVHTATLVPVVLAVAVAGGRPLDPPTAVLLSGTALVAQYALGRWWPAAWRRHRRTRSLARIAVPLAYVGACVQLIGGAALPLLGLFIPVVAGAAAIGAFQGWITASLAALVYLVPELGNLASPAAVLLRGITLAGVALVLAFGTRRIVRALETAVRDARMAAIGERRRTRQIQALEDVGRLLASGGPTPELITEVVDSIAARFDYPHVSVYLGDEREMRLAACHGYDEALPRFDRRVGVAGRVMRLGQIAFVADVSQDPDYVPGTLAATSLICAPMLVDDQLVGLLNVETSGGRRLDATDRTLVGILAARLATAIALGRERQALAARVDLFRDLERFGREISTSLALEPLSRTIVDAVARLIQADTVAITLLDREDGRYRVRAVHGLSAEAVGRPVEPGDGLAGRAIRDRAVVVDDAMTPDKRPAALRDLPVPTVASGVAHPLIRDAVVVGALTVGRVSGSFSAPELEAVQLLAGSTSLAVANAFLHAEVQASAVRDPLTGLYNRRHFDEALDRMLAGYRRQRLSGAPPLSAVVFDLDHFGTFNKLHGHQVGDEVIVAFARVLRSRFRRSDLVARLGGEEFIAVIEGAGRAAAAAVAEEVRTAVAGMTVTAPDGASLRVTVSAGCAEVDPAEPTREALLRTADVALFMAKRSGRDRVVAA